MEVYQVPLKDETSYFTAFLSSVYKELLYKFGVGKSVAQLTFTAQRFLYGKTVKVLKLWINVPSFSGNIC